MFVKESIRSNIVVTSIILQCEYGSIHLAGACTCSIKLLEDVTDRGKMSKLTEDANAGVMYSCVTHNYHCSFCCVTINAQDILKLVVQKMNFMWETKYLWVDTLAMHARSANLTRIASVGALLYLIAGEHVHRAYFQSGIVGFKEG